MPSNSRAALHALQALFEPQAPVFVVPSDSEQVPPPSNLDEAILADEGQVAGVALYRWFKGVDRKGVVRYFKFQRGLALGAWHELLRRQQLSQVTGPFRTLERARAAT